MTFIEKFEVLLLTMSIILDLVSHHCHLQREFEHLLIELISICHDFDLVSQNVDLLGLKSCNCDVSQRFNVQILI